MGIGLAHDALRYLSELGQALNIGRPLVVFNGGRVGVKPQTEKENQHEHERTGGSAAGSRSGPERGEGPPDSSCSIGCGDQSPAVDGVTELQDAYPGLLTFDDLDGTWLVVPGRPLGRSGPRVRFIVSIPSNSRARVRSWGFLDLLGQTTWLGPRHTNYPDGSICAFPDGHWQRSDGLTRLMDHYSEWAVRHLHLAAFDRWPGQQVGLGAYYYIAEFKAGEACWCGSRKNYFACCRPKDIEEVKRDPEGARTDFLKLTGGIEVGQQRPPCEVVQFAFGLAGRPPALADVHAEFRFIAAQRRLPKKRGSVVSHLRLSAAVGSYLSHEYPSEPSPRTVIAA